MTTTSTQTRYRIQGMDCASCATKIDTAVRRVSGIENVSVSVTGGTMVITHLDSSDLKLVEKKVRALGYSIAPVGLPSPVVAANDREAEARDHGDDHHHDHEHDRPAHLNKRLHSHDHAPGKRKVTGLHGHDQSPTTGPWWVSKKALLTLASGLAVAAALAISKLSPSLSIWAFGAAMLIGLVPIVRRAIMAALNGTPFSIEMLMTIAAVGSVIIGAGEEGATVVFLFLVGELLEGVAAGKARASIQSLATLVPKTAQLEHDGQTKEVPAESLRLDATIVVRPGDRVPADGLILSGESTINEAPITGESTPVRKGEGAAVYAGSVNGEGVLRVLVTAEAADNTIARVVRLVEEAQETKAPTERIIDRFSNIYTPGVLIVAALVAVAPPLLFGGAWTAWIYKGLAILLIGCPCALVISTPAAIAASLSAGARRGLLIKGGAVLETLGKITAVALDKTGTLTEGTPKVTDLVGLDRTEEEILTLSAALEAGSNHPLAKAILAQAAAKGLSPPPVTGGEAIGGHGIAGQVNGLALFLGSPKAAADRAEFPTDFADRIGALNDQGKTVSVLLIEDKPAGLVAMRDEPRSDAKAGLKLLVDAGVKVVMLTGDNARTARAIGGDLGIEVQAGLLPQDKQRIVGELMASGLVVAKVGDGINDAPALAAADVGVAMGAAADVALETADAAILRGKVSDVAAMIKLSKRTMTNIRQNITVALGLKVVFLVTTLVGLTGLWPAILADTGATVLVTMNALRLLRSEKLSALA